MSVKRKLQVYAVLFVFGAVVWGTADEFRYRPQWAQFGVLAFWTFVAAVFVSALAETTADDALDEERRARDEWERRVTEQAEENPPE